MPKVTRLKTETFTAALDREDLERLILQWLDRSEPDAARRYIATVTFNTGPDGKVTGAMVDATARAE